MTKDTENEKRLPEGGLFFVPAVPPGGGTGSEAGFICAPGRRAVFFDSGSAVPAACGVV